MIPFGFQGQRLKVKVVELLSREAKTLTNKDT
jgi:hypothetical protein